MSKEMAARDTSNAVQLFQDAHQKMVMLKRVDEQMTQLSQRRRSLMDELRSVQSQINEEFDRMFTADGPARLKSLTAPTLREPAFADEAVLDDEAVA
jgi:hypothetical protein